MGFIHVIFGPWQNRQHLLNLGHPAKQATDIVRALDLFRFWPFPPPE